MLDESEWPDQPDLISEGGEEIQILSDSEGTEAEVSADDESIASDTPSTEIEDVWTRDWIAQPTARALETKNP